MLLHGFAVQADLNWRRPKIIESLSKEFRVIAMDLRGHGLSGKPHKLGEYGTKMIGDVVHLLDHLKISRAHIAGYSLGGFLALKMATLFPKRFYSLAVMGAGWEHPNKSRFLKAMKKAAKDLKAGHSIGPVAAQLDPKREKPGFLHTLWGNLMTGFFNDRLALVGVLEGLKDLVIKEQVLRQMKIPTCSTIGEKDPLLPGAIAMVKRLSKVEHAVILGADHIRTPMRRRTHHALLHCLRKYNPKHR